MKLSIELFRHGFDLPIPYQKRGLLAMLLRPAGTNRHIEILADADEQFDLAAVKAAFDKLATAEHVG